MGHNMLFISFLHLGAQIAKVNAATSRTEEIYFWGGGNNEKNKFKIYSSRC
jgi:hypothetical protein